VSATVWDPRSLSPLDPALLDHASNHALVLVAEDGVAEGGVGSLVSSALWAAGGDRSPRVLCAGVPVAYVPHGRAADILADLALDGPGISARVLGHLGRRWENQAQVSAP
jgi:1-deoxy-D-xylulose-5-phosphate synthase